MNSPAQAIEPSSHLRQRAPSLAEGNVDHGLLAELTGFSMRLAWVFGHELLKRGFGETDITPHRFSMLEVISRNPGLRQTQLAAALALSHPATTLAIDFWEARGCVERRKIPNDRRSFGVFTTREGERELDRLRGLVREADLALTAGLTQSEIAELRRLLGKIRR